MILNLLLVCGVFLFQESICSPPKNENRKPEYYEDYAGKIATNEHLVKPYILEEGNVDGNRIGGKEEFSYGGKTIDFVHSNGQNLKGKTENDGIGGKDLFIFRGKNMDEANKYISGKMPEDLEGSNTYKLKAKIEDQSIGEHDSSVFGGKIMDKGKILISGKNPEDLNDSNTYNLEGKIEEVRIGGKNALMLGGKIMGKTDRYSYGETLEDLEGTNTYNLKKSILPFKGKTEDYRIGGNNLFMFREKNMNKAKRHISGKISKDLEDSNTYNLEGKIEDRIGRENAFNLGGKIMGKTEGYISGKTPEDLEDSHLYNLKINRATNPESVRNNMLNSALQMPWAIMIEDFHQVSPILGYWLKTINFTSGQKFQANKDECLKFFFTVQEVPHYFAGVTDAMLSATKSAVPLVQKVIGCSKGSFMDSMTCVKNLEPEIRDYYLSLAPVFKPPIQAFHAQLVKVKEELEGCLVIKASAGK
uniref:Uncharacterized protein n=1 Tax=Riptortus pedestris TaxID=329032 RepID=R4WHT7_RIPPE|nr:unknown secreted protein [Riptortus pedestris]